MNLVLSNANQTMSSREIAELLNTRHDVVKRTIERLSTPKYHDDLITIKARAVIPEPPLVDGEKSGNNTVEKIYLVGKRESYIIVAQLSPEFTAKLVDRWQELEAQQAPKLPQTKLEWMQLAVEQEQELIAKQAVIDDQVEKLALAAPAVLFVERYVESKSSKSLSDVAKVLGIKPRTFIAQLADDGVIFKRGGSWIAHQQHIDNGRFTVSTGESNGHAFVQTRAEPKGIEWLAKKYGGQK